MPAPDVVIRTSRPGDVEQILALYIAVAAEGRWIGRELPMDHDAARMRIAESVDAPGHYSTVAELADLGSTEAPALDPSYGRSVGHLHLGVAPYGVAELGMQVAAVLRGRGIGRALLDDAIGWARAQPDVHKISLQVWPHNEAAQNLYRTCGFEQEGYLHRHYRRRNGELWDAVVMGLHV